MQSLKMDGDIVNQNRRPCRLASRVALSVMAVLASVAQAQALTEFDLPEQPLADSLRAIAAQTNSNIIFDRKLVDGQSAPPLKRQANTAEALTQLLKGTGLTYKKLDDKTVTIQLASSDAAATTSSTYGNDGRIRLAQAQTTSDQAPRTAPALGISTMMLLEEIVVTGTNIRGVENSAAPLIVLDRAYIEASGLSTTTRLIESLPQNFANATQSGVLVPGVTDGRVQGSAVNLRGIGEGTTLVLLNGRRIALGFAGSSVDIAALPLSAIERVEVLTDGASAIYGSDAVGGVVNFILRSDFEGAETRMRAGSADGADEYSVSQVVGNAWDSGNALFSVDYYKRDLLAVGERDFVPSTTLVGSLLPEDENYSAMFTGRQDLTSSVSLFADALYTNRDSFNRAGRVLQNETFTLENPQLSTTLGVEWRFGRDWQIEASGGYSNNEVEQVARGPMLTPTIVPPTTQTAEFDIESARIKADGTLFTMPGGNVRAAIGADYRSETFEGQTVDSRGIGTAPPVDLDQTVRSAFGELYVPIVGEGNALPGIHSFEVSLAARYDDYSEFGDSLDPKYGIAWEPVGGLKLRGSYGTSYVAPRLLDYNLASTRALGLRQPDPAAGGALSSLLVLLGTDVESLGPQESENLSVGLEIAPESLPGFEIGLNYYDIEYEDRIANTPATAQILGNPAAFGSLIIRNPSAAQIAEALRQGGLGGNPLTTGPGYNPAAVAAIVDQRRRNLSGTNTSGLDLSTRYDFKAGENNFSFGVAATYVLELEQQVTETSPPVDTVDTYNNPTHWRGRASAGWRRAGFATNLFVNHTDSYKDGRPVAPLAQIDAFTTVDLRLAYDFSERFKDGLLTGLTIAAGAQNLLDEEPPRTFVGPNAVTDLGFDPANANPLGRLISIEFTKTW